MSMKTLLVFVVVGVVIVAPAFAQPRSKALTKGWSSRVHPYAAKHYVPWYPSYGNGNMNPDRELADSYWRTPRPQR
jgi:hypothetical protein